MARSCKTLFGIFTSVIGILLGLAASLIFPIMYTNIQAGVWGFLSSIFAAVSCHLHCLHHWDRLNSWHSLETLRGIKFLGFATMTFGIAGMAWYIFLIVYKHIPVLPVSDSAAIPCVWAFMTAKWGFLLLLSAHHYSSYVNDDVPLLS